MHQAVRGNLATFYAAIEEGRESRLAEFVRAEFAGYRDCSVMPRGFAHLACKDCGLPRLVAFTCAGRLKTAEVADVVQVMKARVLKALERRGVVRIGPEAFRTFMDEVRHNDVGNEITLVKRREEPGQAKAQPPKLCSSPAAQPLPV